MGLGLFKTIGKLFTAKSAEAAQAIEDKNLVSFSEQDVRDLEQELAAVPPVNGTLHRDDSFEIACVLQYAAKLWLEGAWNDA